MTDPGSWADTIGPDHHEEMEAHHAAGMERQDEEDLREITRWLTDQMCRVEEPLIGQVSNPLSVDGARRLNDLMQANVHYGGAGLRGIRGSKADIDLVQHWQAEAARAVVLVERCRSWQAVAERLETEMQDLLSVCDAQHDALKRLHANGGEGVKVDMQIVIAWAEQTKLVPTGKHVTRDRNLFPEMRPDWEARAAMWLRSGSSADVEKAKAFAESEGRLVFTFPKTERDALAKARAMAVENARRTA